MTAVSGVFDARLKELEGSACELQKLLGQRRRKGRVTLANYQQLETTLAAHVQNLASLRTDIHSLTQAASNNPSRSSLWRKGFFFTLACFNPRKFVPGMPVLWRRTCRKRYSGAAAGKWLLLSGSR
jgi:hypothetical protein